jgi:hypothetical protein
MRFCVLWLNLLADMRPFFGAHFTIQKLARGRESLPAQAARSTRNGESSPAGISHPARLTLVWLSRWFDWRSALTVVTPRTFIAGHRRGFQFYWRRKSQAGRPPIPLELQYLIRTIARENRRGARSASPTSCG